MLITAIPADPCQFPTADFINKLSVVNKQDYARLHNFELHISSEIDPNVTAVREQDFQVMSCCRDPASSEDSPLVSKSR